MITKILKEEGFDFEKAPADVRRAVDILLKFSDGTLKSENQKLNVLDYNTFLAIQTQFPEDPAVIETKTIVKQKSAQTINDSFNTPIAENFVPTFEEARSDEDDHFNETKIKNENFLETVMVNTPAGETQIQVSDYLNEDEIKNVVSGKYPNWDFFIYKEAVVENEKMSKGGAYRQSRPSPSDSATIHPENYILRGNDGNLWKIIVASNGVQRWQRLRESEQSLYEEGDYYGRAKSKQETEISEKSHTFAKKQKTVSMESKTEFLSFVDQLNRILTKTTFHYHVGDTISSAIKAPFFFKGNVIKDDKKNILKIRLEPGKQLKSPSWKFVMIEIALNSIDEIDIRVAYDEFRFSENAHKDVTLWEHKGHGFQMSEMPELDSIISNHKAEIAENYQKALAEKGEPFMETSSEKDKKETSKSEPEMKKETEETTETLMAESPAPESEKETVSDNPKNITDLITADYENAYELNKAIEKVIDIMHEKNIEPTAEVKQFISGYSGMGGLAEFGAEGKGLLYEYYTPDKIIERMWGLAYKHGYKEGRPVLEPSVGTGRFLKYLPNDTKCLALEINNYSEFIAKTLYGHKAKTRLAAFETLFIKNNSSIKGKIQDVPKFDLVIGNPPYGNFEGRYAGMGEKSYTKAKNYVEYFIFRGLDCLNKDGLLVLIIGAETSAGGIMFLDQPMNAIKEAIAEKGELIDAYRLPNDVFERTSVTSDIIVLKKL